MKALLRLNNFSTKAQTVTVHVRGRGIVADSTHTLTATAGATREVALDLTLAAGATPGRHVIEVRTRDASGAEGCDCYFVVDVGAP